MENKRVKQLQNALIYLAYLEAGSNDGAFGQKTKKAVQKFQLELGLNGDGVAGQKTLRQINKAVKAAPVGGVVVVATGDATDDSADAK
jgi:peptidoglycan hydrolase-like protein with peptidoglycan-binding domain